MFGWLWNWFDRISSPFLDWIQVEVTTCCDSACIYCPHTAMGSPLPKKHMPLDLFCKLIPFIKHTKLIYLQGWGEPLLNQDLFKMVRMCKENKKHVGFTTNGMLLNEKNIRTIIDSEVDILGVSLAGVTAKSHNKFRRGNDFDQVVSNLSMLYKLKREQNSRLPALHLAYLMLRSNFHELEEIIPFAKSLGVEQIVASNLSLIFSKELSSEAIFNNRELSDDYRIRLAKIKASAADAGIVFANNRPDPDENSTRCSENVCYSCVVNVDGEISPCVFTNPVFAAGNDLAGDKTIDYIFMDRLLSLKAISFGNIQHENLSRIWRKKEYVEFRALFGSGKTAEHNDGLTHLPESCINCYKRLTPFL